MSIEVNATEQIIEVNATGSTIDINVTSQTVDVNATTSVIDVNVTNGPGPGVPDGGLTGQVLKKQTNADYDTYWATDNIGVPYLGATGNVDLGEYELKAGQLTLDTSPTGTASVGTTRWNDTIGSSETTLKGGSVILKNGVDLVARVVNKVTPNTTLTKAAYQAVRISGAQGQRLAVAFAQANNDNNSADTIGLVTETIATNQEGFIMTVGNLEDINTTGSLQGETWADGDVLYLSPTVAGAITNIKPVAPQHLVVIGYVEYAHANHGKIYVKVMNGWELGELHDVDTTGATNGQVLTYNGTIWTPQTNAAGNIYNTDGTLTGNRTVTSGGYNLTFTGSNIASSAIARGLNLTHTLVASANNDVLVGLDILPSFTIGAFTGTTSIGLRLPQTSGYSIFQNSANTINSFGGKVTIGGGNLTPSNSLEVWGSSYVNGHLQVQSSNFGGGPGYGISVIGTVNSNAGIANGTDISPTLTALGNGVNLYGLNINPTFNTSGFTGVTQYWINLVGNARINGTNQINISRNGANVFAGYSTYTGISSISTNIPVNIYLNSFVNQIAQFAATSGNLILQNGGTFTDGGQRLQVQGDAFIRGSGNTSGTTALTVQNSSGSNLLRTLNNGYITLGNAIFPFRIYSGSVSGAGDVDLAGEFLTLNSRSGDTPTGSLLGHITINGANITSTASSIHNAVSIQRGITPTSGSAAVNLLNIVPTINQTGGANGITRGLYVNPTLTAAADWRSIEWSNNSGWGLYGAGTSDNYLGGRLSIGTTSQSQGLRIGRAPTAADSRSIFVNPNIQNTVTATYVGVSTSIGLNTSGFTLTNLAHFEALNDGTHTAGVVTNLYGFRENLGTYNATNVFGFYGNIPSGTNRWNLYMNGTANNYMAGSLGIGSTILTAYNLRLQKTLTGGTSAYGIEVSGAIQSDVTTSAIFNSTFGNTQSSNFTLTNLIHYFASANTTFPNVTAGGAVTNQYGFRVESALTGATNNFGFWGNIASGTGRWNLYMNGTADNYLAGSLGIGSTSLTGYNLRVSKNLTGAITGYGALFSGQIQSDVTNQVFGVISIYDTQATTFTLGNLFNFFAGQGTFGAGSTITNQYGFHVASSLTGATNNYGFFGNIAAGTGRWNFFANGTAANYLNGNTIIGGSAVDGGQKLQVNGTTQMTPAVNNSALAISGYSLTGSSSNSIVSITGTWNTTGAGTGIYMNVTNTASDATSRLVDLQVNTSAVFRILPSGVVQAASLVGGFSGTLSLRSNLSSITGHYLILDNNGLSITTTSGNVNQTRVISTFAPTSGTGTYNQMAIESTINQTGGANGITRGLHINPTLTSAADWRSVEMSNNSGWGVYQTGASANNYFAGDIGLGTTTVTNWLNIGASTTAKAHINLSAGSAPTAPANGDIWFDGTDLKMRIGGVTKTFTLV